MMSINPDAHSTDELDLTHWGMEIARKGGVPAERVLNALSLPESVAAPETAQEHSGVRCLRNSFNIGNFQKDHQRRTGSRIQGFGSCTRRVNAP
jgi:DNA polymerase (family 10)